MGEDEYKMTISSRITPKRGLEFLEAFLVGKIDFLHELEPTINAIKNPKPRPVNIGLDIHNPMTNPIGGKVISI